MTVGCTLLALVAVLHEDSPMARLMAERSANRPSTRLAIPSNTPLIDAKPMIVAQSEPLDDLRSSAPPESITDDAPPFSDQLPASWGKDRSHFWNASHSSNRQSATQQKTERSDRAPTFQLGPLFTDRNSSEADGSRATVAEPVADPTPLVTRTYRPASMSAVSLERLVRPLLTARGETIATNSDSVRPTERSSAVDQTRAPSDIEIANRSGMLVVSDRPEAIGRVDALCHDLESMSPRIAIDLIVVSVLPNTGRQLPWDQWRSSFGIAETDLPSVLTQIRGLGRTTVRARSQLQGVSGTWTELECSAQSLNPKSQPDAGGSVNTGGSVSRESANATSQIANASAPTTVTTLHIRPSTQSEGTIRIEVRAQSSHLEDHAQTERSQLVTVRFNTDVVLREGTTGIINLFVDEPNATPVAASVIDPKAALVIPGGSAIPMAKIVPQPGLREQTLLLLMPRIAAPQHSSGKIAASKTRNPA